MIDERLVYEVLSVVEEIPYGKVATYGQIAWLIGREKNVRLVGKSSAYQNTMGSIPAIVWSTTWDGPLLGGRNSRGFFSRKEFNSKPMET